jgi:hypothetical protein
VGNLRVRASEPRVCLHCSPPSSPIASSSRQHLPSGNLFSPSTTAALVFRIHQASPSYVPTVHFSSLDPPRWHRRRPPAALPIQNFLRSFISCHLRSLLTVFTPSLQVATNIFLRGFIPTRSARISAAFSFSLLPDLFTLPYLQIEITLHVSSYARRLIKTTEGLLEGQTIKPTTFLVSFSACVSESLFFLLEELFSLDLSLIT